MIKNLILALKILVYGFISLVTLIGITSVFNTINTSIALRRKEFAVLRSIGLTPNGFNKTLCFESLFFGLKALFYGIPVALGVIRDVDAPTYNDAVHQQIEEVKQQKKYHTFAELLETNDIWEVK